MSERKIKLMGVAYAETGDVSISCLVAGQETHGLPATTTHAGTMPEFNPDNPLATPEEILYFNVDHTEFTSGNVPVSITPTNGDIMMVEFVANHLDVNDPVNTFVPVNSTDYKLNVKVDGVNVTPEASDREGGLDGQWHYKIAAGETLTCEIIVGDLIFIKETTATGDGSTTAFVVAGPVTRMGKVQIDGVELTKAGNWSFDDASDTVTFTTAPANGTTITFTSGAPSTEA